MTRSTEEPKLDSAGEQKQGPLQQIVQPILDLLHAPRALWGVNLGYLLEGFVYFGMLGYLSMFFRENVGLSDQWSSVFVGFLTWGITFSMFLFGGLADKYGVRSTCLAAFVLLLVGRVLVALGPSMGLQPDGLGSPIHLLVLGGLLFVILGYGMYMPAAYAAARQFTTEKTSAMAYAMLYALMNLGGWLPSFFSPIRKAVGISGAFWVYTGVTLISLVVTFLILSRRTVEQATAEAKRLRQAEQGQKPQGVEPKAAATTPAVKQPFSIGRWLKNHPLADPKFSFFIFALIPVQTLFAHNWLTLPLYVERSFRGQWIGDNFEAAVNFNPLLIFILVPIITALTQKKNVYNMMIWGTLVMASPTFLLALGATPWTLAGYLIIMTIGEAMWQPRFLQYAAEIAPAGRTGAYMGVAQFPWFLTKMITSLYAGWFLSRYCPDAGALNTEAMWLIYGCIAVSSSLMLVLARGWLGKDFKTKAA